MLRRVMLISLVLACIHPVLDRVHRPRMGWWQQGEGNDQPRWLRGPIPLPCSTCGRPTR